MLSYKSQNVSIKVREAEQILLITWEGYTTSKEYREVWEKALEIAVQYHINKWLIDQREAGTIIPNDLRWATEDWYPRAIKELGDARKIALIPSKSAFGEMTIKKTVENMESMRDVPMSLAYFQDNEEALNWLLL